MALIACKECGESVSSEAKACPKCGAPVPQAKNHGWAWLIGIPVVGFGLWMVKVGNDPVAQEKARDRDVFELCMKDLENPLTDPGAKNFIRGTCAKMKADFREKYGVEP